MNTTPKHKAADFDFDSATRVPENILFGTSTWTYKGWKNLIYRKTYKSEKEFKALSLGEYAACPLFRTVGIDNTFYTPPSVELLERYASLVPASFLWVSKVWERLTIPRYPSHARYGKYAGQDNPDFLSSDIFTKEVLPPYQREGVVEHTGPFVFQFPSIAKSVMEEEQFLEKLRGFLTALPDNFRYAVETRNRNYLGDDYFGVLNEANATHCFNHWNYMPALKEQMKMAAAAGGLKADFYVARILTPRHMKYQDAVRKFEPYDQLKEPLPEMRQDVIRLARRAVEKNAAAFVIVNNRAEGNAPMTIDALGRMIVSEL